jgi:hypothetical protein
MILRPEDLAAKQHLFGAAIILYPFGVFPNRAARPDFLRNIRDVFPDLHCCIKELRVVAVLLHLPSFSIKPNHLIQIFHLFLEEPQAP